MTARWTRRLLWPVLAVLGALALSASSPASAAPPTSATADLGRSAVLDRAAHAFENVMADRGWAGSATLGTGADGNVLVYVPPTEIGDGSDTVRYRLDGADRAVQLTIQAPTLLGGDLYTRSFKALFVLFILAVLVENGLALLFHWQPYYTIVDTRRADPLVAFGLSLLFVSLFDLDVTTSLLRTYTDQVYTANWPGRILTAMIIAGGSAGVNRIFQALGFRSVLTPEQTAAKPQPNEAWLSVRLAAEAETVGDVKVWIGPAADPALVGVIETAPARIPAPFRYFLRYAGRFPRSGGHTVTPDTDCVVRVEGVDATGKKLTATTETLRLGPRALVDLTLNPRPS